MGRPPTDAEFAELGDNLADALHGTGFWDTLDLTIRDVGGA